MLRRSRSLVKVAVLWIRRAGYAVRGALPLAHGVSLLAPTPRYHRLGPAAALCNPSVAAAKTLVPTPLTLQAEGLILQRSSNMTGYKHVGQDKSKPRQFQVKMWRNGKQARLVRIGPKSVVPHT